MKAGEKFFKKPGNRTHKGRRKRTAIIRLCFLSNVCFLVGVAVLVVCKFIPVTGSNTKTIFGIDPNTVSMLFALFGLNVAVTFFIPMLITKNQVIDTVRYIVDQSVNQKFIEEKMERYATQMSIADLLRKVSTLLFWQERYIWSLSCALRALNEYMKITPDREESQINDMWISIEAMVYIISNKCIVPLLKTEFPISNEEIELMEKKGWSEEDIQSKRDRLASDKKDMLIRFYIEIFELVYRKEELIHIMGDKFKKQVDHCLDIPVRSIIDMTARECDIKSEEIESEIRKNAVPFKKAKTRGAAEKTLKELIRN